MADQENEVFLSTQHIQQWMNEYSSLVSERTNLTTRQEELQKKLVMIGNDIQDVYHKLRAAIPFYPKIGEWLQEQEFASESTALTDAILKALAQLPPGHPVNRAVIQQSVPQFGYSSQKLQANQNYMYIALKRLMDRKLINEIAPSHFVLTNAGRAEAAQKR
jgi:hypothetical protein